MAESQSENIPAKPVLSVKIPEKDLRASEFPPDDEVEVVRQSRPISGSSRMDSRPPTPLFPEELETTAQTEPESEAEMKILESGKPPDEHYPEETTDSASASSRSRATLGRSGRWRMKREITITGPEADLDFVERIAKIAPKPDTRVLSFYQPKHNVCEEYRLLGKNILHTFSSMGGNPARGRVVAVTSSVRNEGKTLTCVNLAMTLAQDLSDRVLLIDGDLRHPRVHSYIGVPGGTGLNDLLSSPDPLSILEDCILRTDSGLHLLMSSASGTNPAPILDNPAMTNLLQILRERYAMVIIDTPPVLLATDALTLGSKSDGMLFLIRARKTQREQIQEARQRIARLDIRMIGYVMNQVKTFLPVIWRYRYYYYGHY